MRIVEGRLVFEMRKCWCENGISKSAVLCPRYGQAQRGKVCLHCGTKTKEHKTIGWQDVVCSACKGQGEVLEDRYDSFPLELWKAFTFKVYRKNREMTWVESHIGVGVFSCTDYGEAWSSSDEKVIASVRDERSTYRQATKISDEEGKVCDHIGIFVAPQGYSVIAVFGNKVHL